MVDSQYTAVNKATAAQQTTCRLLFLVLVRLLLLLSRPKLQAQHLGVPQLLSQLLHPVAYFSIFTIFPWRFDGHINDERVFPDDDALVFVVPSVTQGSIVC